MAQQANFTRETAERVLASTLSVETQSGNPSGPPFAIRPGMILWRAKTDSPIAKEAFGNVTVYSGDSPDNVSIRPGSTGDLVVSAYNLLDDLETDLWCWIVRINGGWEIISAQCPPVVVPTVVF